MRKKYRNSPKKGQKCPTFFPPNKNKNPPKNYKITKPKFMFLGGFLNFLGP